MITAASIQAVKERLDITEVIGKYINLSQDGANYIAKCPFHNEKTPSFKVSKSKDMYKCFGCAATGNAITFVMDYKNKNFPDAVSEIAGMYGISLELEDDTKEKIRPTQSTLAINHHFIEFFKSRGIKSTTLEEMKVTGAKEWMPAAKKEVDTICFNYYRNEELINIKYRAEHKDFKLHKGSELIFYNMDSLKGADCAVIVEGEIDALSVHQAGCTFVISVPNGASNGANQNLPYLDNCWEVFRDIKQVILMVDNDEPGVSLRDELARRIGRDKCLRVDWPEGIKDANDMLMKHGEQAIIKLITEAQPYPIEGIISVADVYNDVLDYYQKGYPEGTQVGIEGLDEYISFMPGQFTTVTGIPGCFHKHQLIHTSNGVKPISEIKNGDMVLSYNHEKRINEYRTVYNTISHETHNDKLYEIKMKDGTVIKVTENHEFFTGTGYVKIKDLLLSLGHEKMGNDTKI